MKKTVWRSYKFINGAQIICRKMSASELHNAVRDNGKLIAMEVMK